MKMPVPKSQTFGDKRPAAVMMPAPPDEPGQPRRVLKPDARPIPEIQAYRQTNGPLYLVRLKYNGVWLTTTGADEPTAINKLRQFYMRETAQGRADSVEVTP